MDFMERQSVNIYRVPTEVEVPSNQENKVAYSMHVSWPLLQSHFKVAIAAVTKPIHRLI